MAGTSVEALPEECLSHVISFTSPQDACQSAAVSTAFRDAADSDLTWVNFLPLDYREIVSRSVTPVEFSSLKDLFRRLSSAPLLVDGGRKTFAIDKSTNKKCYMLSARELSIAWSSNDLCWSWKSLLNSRFPEVVELIMVCWLEIQGKISIGMLSSNTTYGAYIIIQLMDRAFGIDTMPLEISVEVGGDGGDHKTKNTINYLKWDEHKRRRGGPPSARGGDHTWLEIELGEFYNNESEHHQKKEVEMWFGEIKGVHLKGGLVVEGIELRPKH